MDVENHFDETKKLLDALEERLNNCQMAIFGTKESQSENQRNLILEVLNLDATVEKLFKGPFVEFEKKCSSIQTWLDNPSVTPGSLSQSSLTKLNYILQHQQFLSEMSENFKMIESLQSYVSFPMLEDLPKLKQKLDDIEQEGFFLGEQVNTLKESLFSIITKHSTTMNMMAGVFKNWDEQLTEIEERKMKV